MAFRNILVTGGCGFCGSAFVRYVVERDLVDHVTVLDKLTYAGRRENLAGLPADRVTLVVGDICDTDLLARVVPGHDAIVHYAAESHNDNSIADAAPFLRTNVQGTYALLEAARAHNVRFHHVSTDEVFGDTPLASGRRFAEGDPYRPSSPYAATKASSDLLVRAWHRTYGVRATITNCTNNYGPRQHEEKFIPQAIARVLRGERPLLYGDGRNVRDWIHVDDHAAAVWTVLAHGRVGETYLVGARNEHSNLDVLRFLLARMGAAPDFFERVPDRPGHDLRYALDPGKIERELGWRPAHTDFAAGLDATIAWYRDAFQRRA